MKKILFICITFIAVLFTSCQPEYIESFEWRSYTVVDKEFHTELDPAVEFFIGVKDTKQVYTLVLERNGNIIVEEVDSKTYYKYPLGSTYNTRVCVKKPNPKYKKK